MESRNTSTLTIYDSQGHEYGTGQRGADGNELIKKFFFGGVKLAVDTTGRDARVVAYFRAREESGRSEQYYAVYSTRDRSNLLGNFKRAVEDAVREHGLTLNTSPDDVTVFADLHSTARTPEDADIDLIRELLSQNKDLTFGVRTYSDALGLFQALQSSADVEKIAISNKGRIEKLRSFDVVIEKGSYRGVEPIDGTKQHVTAGRKDQQEKMLRDAVSSTRSDIRELQQSTDLSDAQIRRAFQQQIHLFTSQTSSTSTSTSRSKPKSRSSKDNLLASSGSLLSLTEEQVVLAKTVGLMVGILLFGLALAYGSTFVGDPLGFGSVLPGV